MASIDRKCSVMPTGITLLKFRLKHQAGQF